LTNKPAFGGVQVAVLIFREVGIACRSGAELKGVKKGLYYKEEEDRRHVVALMYAGGVVDFGIFFSNFYLNFAIFVEFFDGLDEGGRQAILEKDLA